MMQIQLNANRIRLIQCVPYNIINKFNTIYLGVVVRFDKRRPNQLLLFEKLATTKFPHFTITKSKYKFTIHAYLRFILQPDFNQSFLCTIIYYNIVFINPDICIEQRQYLLLQFLDEIFALILIKIVFFLIKLG